MKKPTLRLLASIFCLSLFSLLSSEVFAGCPMDTVPPKAICPLLIDRVELDANGIGILPANIGDSLSTDDCAPVVKETSATDTFYCEDVGLQHVLLVATDDAGNSDTVSCNFVVRDKLAPIATCPDPMPTLYLDDAGSAYLPANIGDGSSIDNCGPVTELSQADTFSCADTGTQSVLLTASDTNGNSSTIRCYFEVLDTTPPVAICPLIFTTDTLIKVYLTKDGEFIIPAVIFDTLTGFGPLLQSTDNCDVIEYFAEPTFYDCDDVGKTSVLLTAEDPSGNIDTVSCYFTLLDTFSPQAYCNDLTVYLNFQGVASIDSSDVNNNSFDACGIQRIQLSKSEFTCADIGIELITVTFTDSNSNVSTCESIITIEDTIQPVAKCIGDTFYLSPMGFVTLELEDIDDGSFDNCLDTIVIDPTIFDCDDAGEQFVTLTITDLASNSDTCVAKITVIDSTAPKAICKINPILSLNPSKYIKVSPAAVDGGSYDNCSFKLDAKPFLFDCNDVGQTHTITLTITDQFGKQDSCTSELYLYEAEKPIALCLPSLTVGLDSLGNANISPDMIDAGSSDNCGIENSYVDFPIIHCGWNTVTLTVEDASGNTASCATSVYTIDTIAPTVVCNDLKVNLGSSGVAKISMLDVEAVSFDGCGIKKKELSQKTFSCLNEGSNTETLTVKDNNNNVTICFFNVEVIDNDSICVHPCDTTRGLAAIPSYRTAQLSWDIDSNAVEYIVEGSTMGDPLNKFSVSDNVINAIGLYEGTDYQWRVRTVHSGDTSAFSAFNYFTTLNCESASNLSTTSVSENQATLSWDPVPGAIGYRLVGGTGNSIQAEFNLFGSNNTSYTASSLANSTSYNWAVYVVCNLSPFVQSNISSINNFTTSLSNKVSDISRLMEVEISPNPNNGEFILELINIETQTEIQVIDLAGKIVYEFEVDTDRKMEIDLKYLESGIYFMKTISGNNIQVKRFIKE
ncbi:MAG: T9SS type A sorting domain-containing protein [Bacteroidia bacterium]|nr:T9SS type A sorting domain-containing protein [Bacteroidia bacterium]